ncbi:Type II secretion system protein E [Polystyrenella longa]|uniref:Type II secretion system protein E n=1 Tax=Polystyrenella longa TaxID=2528007 RepID=A0A518CKT0_9PLAN|nr:ATPase, T2SS/T4P/T4SS family [Polystyrenella longa]QDU79827.1 Type II secretion system protein E [Polystyrenella longa]
MIFRRKKKVDDDHEDDDLLDDEFDEEEEELETVLFQGATEGREVDLSANTGLVRAALMPVKELISDAIDRRSERLVIEPRKGGSIVRLDIDGVGFAGDRYPGKQALGVTQMIKVLAGLDSKVRSKKQSGGIKAQFMGVPYRLSVESVPTQLGAERVIVKIRNMKDRLESTAQLGFTDEMREQIRKMTSDNNGIFLVCGPPGSGVTRTLHGSILCVDLYLKTIFNLQKGLNLEDVPGLSKYDYQDELGFEENIVRAHRKEADGAIVDAVDTPEKAMNYIKSCHKMTFFTELSAPTAAHGLKKMVELVGDPKLVAENVKGILCPKLIRKLRDDIKEAYRPNPKLVHQLGLPPETNILYRPPTAPVNEDDDDDEEDEPLYEGLPYEGRTAIYELIEMTDEIKSLLISGADAKQISQKAKSLGMLNHQQGAMNLVARGVTSLEEVRRVFKS